MNKDEYKIIQEIVEELVLLLNKNSPPVTAYCCGKFREQSVEEGHIVTRNSKHYLRFLESGGLGTLETVYKDVEINNCPFCGSGL